MRDNKHPIIVLGLLILLTLSHDARAQVEAVTATVGSGCGMTDDASVAPQLLSTRPLLGEDVGVMISDAPPGGVGYMLLSLPPSAPSDLGGGCMAYVDLAAPLIVGPLPMDAQGSWMLAFTLDLPSTWLGVEVRMQAAVLHADGDMAFATTNGLHWVIGDV